MAKYPNQIYEPREKENRAGVVYDPNKKTVIFAEDIKALDDEVKAIETELGTNPRGNFDSVKAFLQYLLSKVKDYFTDLLDVPHSYQGQAGKVLKVKQTEDGLEFGEAGGGVTKHTQLTDKEVNGVIDHALKSVRDGHLYNFQAWKRLLATQPYKALEILRKTWVGATGEDYCRALTFDGTYIYAGLYTSPARVIKIDPSTMTTISSWTPPGGENLCSALTFDGTYIYAGLWTLPAKMYKINPSTMTTVASWTAPGGDNFCTSLTFDGTYIYAACNTVPARVIKIDPSTMTTISRWIGASGENTCWALTFDGTYIYAGLSTSPARIIRKIMRNIDEVGV